MTENGDVYRWSFGASTSTLTRSPSTAENIPAIVSTLKGVKIVDISCGGCLQIGDAFFMALTETGLVYSWGDADFGKCGRGSEVSKTPRIIEKLQGLQVEKIFCGGQFSLALCRNGAVYTWVGLYDFKFFFEGYLICYIVIF